MSELPARRAARYAAGTRFVDHFVTGKRWMRLNRKNTSG